MATTRFRCGFVLAMAGLLAICPPVRADLETEIEEGIGRWMARAFIAGRGRLDQPPVAGWVSNLGQQLAQHSSRQALNYHFVVLDSPEANGFALPGGWIFITAGLLETMHSEDELAAVLAHEIAHLAERDFQRIVLQQAIFLGIAHILHDRDAGDWVPVMHAVQLVETLRDSRYREARADRVGTAIAWRGGYDPRAMAAFLGDDRDWSYLENIFATHPHPRKRGEWIDEHFEALRTDDPAGVNALAESLIDRGRYVEANSLLQQPLPDAHEDRRKALLERAAALRPDTVVHPHDSPLPDDSLAALQDALTAVGEGREASEEKRSLAWNRLERIWADDQIRQALLYAQAFDLELDDSAYLALVAQTVHLMHRTARGANLVARTVRMQSSNADSMNSLGRSLNTIRTAPEQMPLLEATAAEVAASGRELGQRLPDETSELARLAGEYHDSGRLVALFLAELGLSGRGYPLGRMTFSRFMVIQAQVRMLAVRLDRLDAGVENIAAAQWRDAIRARRLQLNATGLQVAPSALTPMVRTLARRMGVTPQQFHTARDETGGIGDAALQLLRQQIEPDDARFGSDLRATQIMMRIAFIETQEQVAYASAVKDSGDSPLK